VRKGGGCIVVVLAFEGVLFERGVFGVLDAEGQRSLDGWMDGWVVCMYA